MKRILLVYLALFCGLTVLGFDVVLPTENGTANLTCTIISSADRTVKIKAANNKTVSGDFVIPETISYNGVDYTVVELENSAFYNRQATSITVPETVTKIGTSAFSSMKQLKSITFPSSLQELPNNICTYDDELTTVILPANVRTLGDYAFRGCPKLQNVTYNGYTGSNSVAFPPTLNTLKRYAFCGTGFTEITVPDHITEINEHAFALCPNLEKIHFPNTMTLQEYDVEVEDKYIYGSGYALCNGCTKLTEVNIPANWVWIPKAMFYNCTSLSEIEIPDNIELIGESAFEGCTALTEIDLPDNVQLLDAYVFRNCTGLHRVKMAKEAIIIGEEDFKGCINLRDIKLNYGLQWIDLSAFEGCESLTEIDIPHTVELIADNAFKDCTSLTQFDVPNSVIELGGYGDGGVFIGCSAMQSVRLSNELLLIEPDMFRGCTSLTEICFPPSVTTISENVISGCSNLTAVYMGLNVESIAADAFANSGVTDVYVTAQTPPSVEESSFPASMQRLHVQREKALNLYATTAVWDKYQEVADMVIEPEKVVILQDPDEQAGFMRAPTTQYNTATKIYGLEGDTFKRTAQMQGENPSIPHLFWKSSDPSTAYVDNDGNIHLRSMPTATTPIKLTAQSLYADMPLSEVTVVNYHMTGIEEVELEDSESDGVDGMQIYDLDGRYIGSSLRDLERGIYIVKQGPETAKINIL